jgi:hypothetical protein
MSETLLSDECSIECKFQRDGRCTLEQANWVKASDGAECMSHLFEKEEFRRF